MKKKMITAVLAMAMVLGAGSVSYAAEKTTSCVNAAGQTITAQQLCGEQTILDLKIFCGEQPDFTKICSETFDFKTFCQEKNDKTEKDDQSGNLENGETADKDESGREDSSGNEQPEAGQSSMKQQVVSLVNAERAKQGLAALKSDSRLAEIAQKKAEDMAKNGYFSHTSPTYGSAFDMLKAAGYTYKAAGENIAMGQKSAASVMNGWMNSSGHRANILSSSYEKIGVGHAISSDGTPYWVQIFAA